MTLPAGPQVRPGRGTRTVRFIIAVTFKGGYLTFEDGSDSQEYWTDGDDVWNCGSRCGTVYSRHGSWPELAEAFSQLRTAESVLES